MCTTLYCGNKNNGLCAWKISGAAEGTQCGAGKVCISNQCVESSLVSDDSTCVFGDQLIYQAYFTNTNLIIPNKSMDCDSYLNFYYNNITLNTVNLFLIY